MSADNTRPPVRIACAIVSGNQMDGLHEALAAEIPKVQ